MSYFLVRLLTSDLQNIYLITLKVIRLSIHKTIIHNDDTKDAGPQMQVAEDEYKANILSQKDHQEKTLTSSRQWANSECTVCSMCA